MVAQLALLTFSALSNCTLDALSGAGPHTPQFVQFDAPLQGLPELYGFVPSAGPAVPAAGFPVVVFMRGMTLGWEFYESNLARIASHGFVALFPFVKGVSQDDAVFPIVTQTNGLGFIRTFEWLHNSSSALGVPVDLSSAAMIGHSMGGEDVFKAAAKLPNGTAKVLIGQHPGLCGPFGPPPYPDTYSKAEMVNASLKVEASYLTTAANDRAFRLGLTPGAEKACWAEGKGKGLFVSFAESVCSSFPAEGAAAKLKVAAVGSGHMCACCAVAKNRTVAESPSAPRDHGWKSPELKYVLAALKLHLQDGFSSASPCYELLWGNSSTSLSRSTDAAEVDFRL
eukprot:440080-Prymnesium_polylepis.1